MNRGNNSDQGDVEDHDEADAQDAEHFAQEVLDVFTCRRPARRTLRRGLTLPHEIFAKAADLQTQEDLPDDNA